MGKKGNKGKKKKNAEPEMTWSEALLAYKINIVERQLEDAKYEYHAVEQMNNSHQDRNGRLEGEQELYIKRLFVQARDRERRLKEEEMCPKQQVLATMKDKWKAEKREIKELEELQRRIALTDVHHVTAERKVVYWTDYSGHGSTEDSNQIKLLEQELVDLQISYEEMDAHIKKEKKLSILEMGKKRDIILNKQKHLASEKAMAKMDKHSRQEVLDNDWLKHEVDIHNREVVDLLQKVEDLERKNLQVMSELFECTVEDLKISRNFFLTQFEEPENLEETGILEVDLSKLAVNTTSSPQAERAVVPFQRPASATQMYVEHKVFGMDIKTKHRNEDEESNYDGVDRRDSDDEDPFNTFHHFDDDEFDDYLQLGPLELKLLNISGRKMTIYQPVVASELQANKFTTDSFPSLDQLTFPTSVQH